MDAVSNIQKNKLPTLDHISKALQEATNETVSKKDLLEKLRKLERERIIEGQIINSDDQPIQIWKI